MRTADSLRVCGLMLVGLWTGCGTNGRPVDHSGLPATDPGSSEVDGGVVAANAGTGGASKPGQPGSTPGAAGSKADAPQPLQGATDFVSADGNPGQATRGATGSAGSAAAPNAAADGSSGAATSNRAVERGDIYRVLAEHRILNLNSYRGVQIIDVSDVTKPRIEGRVALAGSPVELYLVGNYAVVLLNNWQGYYGSRDDVRVESVQGGLVASVDISDRTHPVLIDQATVRGYISTSRLTQGDGKAALYVAATNYNASSEAVVKSFNVSDGKLTAKSELSLGGYVQDIQATTDVLMVASIDYNNSQNQSRSQVSIIDISNPDGTMVRGGSVFAQGLVQNKFNMDAYKGVLRIVSGANWNGTTQNHLETFSLSDLTRLAPIDHCTFGGAGPTGQNEMLYATLFVENKAFFVTYYRRDPFHAFSIDDQGRCREHSEYIVSGWNDFLRATLNDTRLIGIGRNDENATQKLSVSLYDAVNLSNPNPLLARADIDLSYSYSEASWDDRGFGVVEGAVSAKAADGTAETGLVLLPFQGWDQANQTEVAQVQIFTFSDHTLTKRGSMDHGSSVRRSFETDVAGTTANLSEDALSLFDTGNPDAPKEQGRVELAPNYNALFVFGDYIARVKDRSYYYSWNGSNQSSVRPQAEVQIVARSIDPDAAVPLRSFKVPAGAELTQVGALLVSTLTDTTYDNTGTNPPQYHTQIAVYDLGDPTHPNARGTLETDRIVPSYGYYYPLAGVASASPRGGPVCIDCDFGGRYGASAQHYVVGNAIAFVQSKQQNKSLGMVHQCYKYASSPACAIDSSGNSTCPTYISGGVTCTTPKGGKETCEGSFYQCDQSNNCTQIADPPNLQVSCNDYEQFRYWQSYAFDTLDLRDPDKLALAAQIALPTDEEGESVVANGTTLYVNHQQPYMIKGDSHAYVKHFVRLLGLADPQQPSVGDPVNLPGDVITVDGSTFYTRDLVWDNNAARTLVARLTFDGKLAHLQTSHLFAERSVAAVQLDGAGHVLVSSDPVYNYAVPMPSTAKPPQHTLSILDAQTLAISGEAAVDQWATFTDAKQGRALFQVSGGLLVFDVRDATLPKAQAYFPTQGWPQSIYFDGNDIMFAAGPYGVYRFDANVFNLLKM